jgi:hypothetical protein
MRVKGCVGCAVLALAAVASAGAAASAQGTVSPPKGTLKSLRRVSFDCHDAVLIWKTKDLNETGFKACTVPEAMVNLGV